MHSQTGCGVYSATDNCASRNIRLAGFSAKLASSTESDGRVSSRLIDGRRPFPRRPPSGTARDVPAPAVTVQRTRVDDDTLCNLIA